VANCCAIHFQFFGSLFGSAKIVESNVATIITSAICIIIMAVFKDHLAGRVKKLIKFPPPIELFVVIPLLRPPDL